MTIRDWQAQQFITPSATGSTEFLLWLRELRAAAISAGTSGTDGADGVNGVDGADGADGADGTNGTNGADGADGASLSGTATITVPANSFEDTETVAAVGVTGASRVNVWLAPHDDADENSPEFLDIAAMQATPGTDTITVTMAFLTKTSGPIKLLWSAV